MYSASDAIVAASHAEDWLADAGGGRKDARMTEPAVVVVVGAGLAGLRVTEELRTMGYGGTLTLIGAEERPPYDRPPLSKKMLTGELDDTSLRPDMESLAVDVRLGESAVQPVRGHIANDAQSSRNHQSRAKQGDCGTDEPRAALDYCWRG